MKKKSFKTPYVYVILNRETGRLLMEDDKLPFYWNRNVAMKRCSLFKDFTVTKVNFLDLEYLAITGPVIGKKAI